jgi:pyruvate dehydrogenase E1 component beta subunit
MASALNAALRSSLASDPRALVLGEDVGTLGGVFRITDGLQAEFGAERVFDTPLAESGIAGVCVGLAMAGWHPVAEMQFDAFSYPALNQVISHVAKYRYRSRGRMGMPLVIRIPFGGAIGSAENHSDSPEVYYAHTVGLKVVVPSSAADAHDLLRASIADPDPVIFFEPKSRYWAKEQGEIGDEPGLPIGRARVARAGTSCTVVAYGLDVEVLDLRSLIPLDVDALAESVTRTGRAVVVHEAPLTAGFGGEIVARIVEEAFDYLEAPVLRVAGYDTPYPPATLERHYVPTPERILAAVERVAAY